MYDAWSINPPLASKPRNQPIGGIVVHWTGGHTLASAISTLRKRGLSYHYLIDRDGKPYKAVATKRIAYHAGNSYGPEHAKLKIPNTQRFGEFTARTSVNGSTLGISLVGGASGVADFTEAQEKTLDELVQWLAVAIPTIYWVAGHNTVSPGRKPDPGRYDLTGLAKRNGLRLWHAREGWIKL